MVVEAHHLERAIQLMDEVGKDLHFVYEEIAPSNIVRHYPKAVRALLQAGGRLSHSELMQRFSHTMNRQEFKEVIGGLEEMGVIRSSVENSGGRSHLEYVLVKKEGK
jgi:hypothetical protein